MERTADHSRCINQRSVQRQRKNGKNARVHHHCLNIFTLTANFLERQLDGKKIWKWLQEHDTNHNGYIEGYGGIEIEGLNSEMLDVQVATAVFLETMADMAYIFNDM
jgi:hypothetical protein